MATKKILSFCIQSQTIKSYFSCNKIDWCLFYQWGVYCRVDCFYESITSNRRYNCMWNSIWNIDAQRNCWNHLGFEKLKRCDNVTPFFGDDVKDTLSREISFDSKTIWANNKRGKTVFLNFHFWWDIQSRIVRRSLICWVYNYSDMDFYKLYLFHLFRSFIISERPSKFASVSE